MVRRALRSARAVPGLVSTMTDAVTATALRQLSAERIADEAVGALLTEALLTPKPGLVDASGRRSHPDMTLALLATSAGALRDPLQQCADAARAIPLGLELRAHIGAIGRAGERRMLAATGGVNTHRGALWALGLLSAGVAATENDFEAVDFASRLARLPDTAQSVSRTIRTASTHDCATAPGEPSAKRGPASRTSSTTGCRCCGRAAGAANPPTPPHSMR